MAAFGSDEVGNTYLDAVRRYCCTPEVGGEALQEIVQDAKAAFILAGNCDRGKRAAWDVLESAGMVLMHDRMKQLGVARPRGPRAAFFCPAQGRVFVLTYAWHLQVAEI